jgi:curli biogenesis system outer membrane secretion channel CsgG
MIQSAHPYRSAARRLAGLLLLLVLAGVSAGAEGGPAAAGHHAYRRWAILAAEPLRSDGTADLLATELSAAGYVLVERDQIAAVTAEQELTAMGPAGGAQRVQLGKLLKADALIFLSTEKGGDDKPIVRIVISDTARGARLSVTRIPLARGKSAAIEVRIAAVVKETRERFAGGVKWVVAVPHFLSKDLAHDFDHLQSGFASLLETTLSERPGVAVLETEEARSIRKELEIGGKANVDRVVPLFVEGTYETQRVASPAATQPGEAWPVQVTLTVVIRDGTRVIRTFERKALPLAAATEALSRELPAAILGSKLERT